MKIKHYDKEVFIDKIIKYNNKIIGYFNNFPIITYNGINDFSEIEVEDDEENVITANEIEAEDDVVDVVSSLKETIDSGEFMTLALSDETTILTTGTSKLTFRAPFAMELTSIPRASLNVASTDSMVYVDINKNGTSILSTILAIDQNETTSKTAVTPAVLSTTSIADDDIITFDIDKMGTTAKGLKVTLYYRRV